MYLPADRTCADCQHFPRCSAIYGHIAADEVCDWSPSRYQAALPITDRAQIEAIFAADEEAEELARRAA